MRDKFVFIPSTDTRSGSGSLGPLRETELGIRDELIGVVVDLCKNHKAAAGAKEKVAIDTMSARLGGNSRANHTALWRYEQAHLTGGESWSTVAEALRSVVDGRGNRRILVHEFTNSVAEFNRGTVQLEGVVDAAAGTYVKLGTVFLGDARFTDLRPQPAGLRNPVYVLGRVVGGALKQDPAHTDAHFVWLPNSGTYVRRFVTRGLNHGDIINIAAGRALGAPVQTAKAQGREVRDEAKQATRHAVAAGTALTEKQQIISHTRGWQKRYISTGVSSRPVFSTRGTQFMSLYGTAVVDLAKVDLSTVFDVHSPIAAQKVMGWDANSVVTARGPGSGARSFKEEEFLALRDVLRTRELLIKFSVPFDALHVQPDGRRIVGVGTAGLGSPERVLSELENDWPEGRATVVDYDALNYRGYDNCFWLFLLCRNAADAKRLHDGIDGGRDARYLLLDRYVMPPSLAGWK